ncbi:MAG: glycine C-acetyltransferase [Acidobacteria bacterium]|nr:glycine C-acetyltransferase [Acidobacteriota bacterium]MBI3422386.1 glycine C-acetyltransferase [Acidobacteriota bacterium]
MNPELIYSTLQHELDKLAEAQTYKYEVPLESEQGGRVRVQGRVCVMLASNNYLGLANHPRIKEAAQQGLDKWGFGMSSVRFLCGTEPIHLELEQRIARFVGCEAAILHSSCFAANEAFFTALYANDFGETNYEDVIYSDQYNHASIIDGVRLCRAVAKQTASKLYRNRDVAHLRELLEEDRDKNYRLKVIATDGVFSMEGHLAPLPELVALAREFGALLFVDESHASGALGQTGRGTPEELGVHGEIDVITGTFGKALGGASGGFIAGRRELVEFLRQKSRPYTFSNTVPPAVVTASIAAIDLIENEPGIVNQLHANTAFFRREIVNAGFTILPGHHAIVPIMLGEAALAQEMSRALLDEGVYIKGLWYPVVPKGEARLRAQISAAHTQTDLEQTIAAFKTVGKKLGVI